MHDPGPEPDWTVDGDATTSRRRTPGWARWVAVLVAVSMLLGAGLGTVALFLG